MGGSVKKIHLIFIFSDPFLEQSFEFPKIKTACFTTITEGYSKGEIAYAEEGQLLAVNVSMNIIGFLEVDELGQNLKVA